MFTKRVKQVLLATSLALVLATPLSVHADTPTPEDTELTSSGSAKTEFTITNPSKFKVSIPKTVTITNPDSTTFAYKVKVYGELSEDDVLTLVPDSEVDLVSNGSRADIPMTVVLEAQSWNYTVLNNIATENIVNGDISVKDADATPTIPSGTWTTKVNFAVNLLNYEPIVYTWSDDLTTCTATKTCSNDGSATITETVSVTSEVTASASYESKGTTTYTAIFTNSAFTTQTKNIDIDNAGLYDGDGNLLLALTKTMVETDYTYPNCPSVSATEYKNAVKAILPASVTSIGTQAFYACSNLTDINIPDSVTSIGGSAFIRCKSLTSITIPNSVTSIGTGAFASCGNLTSITVDSANPVYDSRNNCNAIIKTATNTLIAGCQNTVIPDSVTTIDDYAFKNCPIASINIPDSVTSIGNQAFYSCPITEITIPDSVTSIGVQAFTGCKSLTSITIGNSVTSIGDYAFSVCDNLGPITIPASVTSIGQNFISNCMKVTSITFENPTGWYMGDTPGAKTSAINFSTPSANPNIMRGTYYNKYWTR